MCCGFEGGVYINAAQKVIEACADTGDLEETLLIM
jgi:hypothetical protein